MPAQDGNNTNEAPKTLSVPEAGKRYYDLGRNASYEAAKRGDIPFIQVGSLAGLEGRIVREAGQTRFVVAVDFIQQGAWVTLDDYALAALAEERPVVPARATSA